MKNETAIRSMARQCVSDASAYLEKKHPSASAEEAALFHSHLGAEVIAEEFAKLYSDAGSDAAANFLQETLSKVTAGIRLRKAPVMPVFRIELHPAAEGVGEPSQAPDGQSCACKVENNRCAACVETLSEEYSEFARNLFIRLKSAGKIVESFIMGTKACRACFAGSSDQAIAKLVPSFIPELVERPELVPVIAGGLVEVAAVGGLTEAPLTTEALKPYANP